jgi:bisphosphoglycerate-independent phosphoglycerate mutase (AlkP superfamily)
MAIVARLKANPAAKLHLMGIVSDGGVHGMLEHLYGILRQAKEDGLAGRVFIHAFTDGRDTPPQSGLGYIQQVEAQLKQIGVGRIATVCGRFWAMDRDNRWERVQKAYDMLTGKKAVATATSAEAASLVITRIRSARRRTATSSCRRRGSPAPTAGRWRPSPMATPCFSTTTAATARARSPRPS